MSSNKFEIFEVAEERYGDIITFGIRPKAEFIDTIFSQIDFGVTFDTTEFAYFTESFEIGSETKYATDNSSLQQLLNVNDTNSDLGMLSFSAAVEPETIPLSYNAHVGWMPVEGETTEKDRPNDYVAKFMLKRIDTVRGPNDIELSISDHTTWDDTNGEVVFDNVAAENFTFNYAQDIVTVTMTNPVGTVAPGSELFVSTATVSDGLSLIPTMQIEDLVKYEVVLNVSVPTVRSSTDSATAPTNVNLKITGAEIFDVSVEADLETSLDAPTSMTKNLDDGGAETLTSSTQGVDTFINAVEAMADTRTDLVEPDWTSIDSSESLELSFVGLNEQTSAGRFKVAEFWARQDISGIQYSFSNDGGTTYSDEITMTAERLSSVGTLRTVVNDGADVALLGNSIYVNPFSSYRAITGYDALQALRISVDDESAPSYSLESFVAADFDSSGTVTASDALGILETAAYIRSEDRSTEGSPMWTYIQTNVIGDHISLGTNGINTTVAHDDLIDKFIGVDTNIEAVAVLKGDTSHSYRYMPETVDPIFAYLDGFLNTRTEVGGVLTLIGTSENDELTVSTSDFKNLTIDTFEGIDVIKITGIGMTLEPYISNVEVLDVTRLTGTSTISLANSPAAAGLEIQLYNPRFEQESFAGVLTLANDAGATAFDIYGAHAGSLTTTTSGAVTLDAAPAGGVTEAQFISTNINANSASSMTVDVAKYANLSGTVSANSAESFTLTTTLQDVQTTVEADKASTLTFTANSAHLDLTGDDFASARSMNLSGSGTLAQITVGAMGSSDLSQSGSALMISGLQGGVDLGQINSGAGALIVDTTAALGSTGITSSNSGNDTIFYHSGSLGELSIDGQVVSSGSVTFNSENAIGNLYVGGPIRAEGDVRFNLDGMLGGFNVGPVASESVTINALTYHGSGIMSGVYTVDTVAAINLNASGTYTVQHSEDQTDLVVSLNTGIGTDQVTINHGALTSQVIVTGDLGADSSSDMLTIGTNTVKSNVDTSGVFNVEIVGFDIGATGAHYIGGDNVDIITDSAAIIATSSISTGGGADIIILDSIHTAEISIEGGAGADHIALVHNAPSAEKLIFGEGDSGLSLLTVDHVYGFTPYADKISFGLQAGTAINFAELNDDLGSINADTFKAGLTAANAVMDGTVLYVLHENTNAGLNDGYLYVDYDADGSADLAVILHSVNMEPSDTFGWENIVA